MPPPRAHGVAGFGVFAFGELSTECPELCNFVARVQAASYVAYYGDKTPKEAIDAQRPRIRCLWGLTTQVGGARLIIERCIEFISPGDSESPVTDLKAGQDAETFENASRLVCSDVFLHVGQWRVLLVAPPLPREQRYG